MKAIQKIGFVLGAAAASLTPFVAFAQTGTRDVQGIISLVQDILNLAIPVLIAFAVVWFIVNVVKYVVLAGSDEKRAAARTGMIHGLVGLFVLVAFWGLVNLVVSTLNLDTTTPNVGGGQVLPGIQTGGTTGGRPGGG